LERGGKDFDAVAVSYGPGLMGSLLTGVENGKIFGFTSGRNL